MNLTRQLLQLDDFICRDDFIDLRLVSSGGFFEYFPFFLLARITQFDMG